MKISNKSYDKINETAILFGFTANRWGYIDVFECNDLHANIFLKLFRSNIIITVFWMEMKKTLTLLVVVITI